MARIIHVLNLAFFLLPTDVTSLDQLLIYKTMIYQMETSVRLSVSVALVCFVLVGNIVNSYKAL